MEWRGLFVFHKRGCLWCHEEFGSMKDKMNSISRGKKIQSFHILDMDQMSYFLRDSKEKHPTHSFYD
jgi:hypothetical protein